MSAIILTLKSLTLYYMTALVSKNELGCIFEIFNQSWTIRITGPFKMWSTFKRAGYNNFKLPLRIRANNFYLVSKNTKMLKLLLENGESQIKISVYHLNGTFNSTVPDHQPIKLCPLTNNDKLSWLFGVIFHVFLFPFMLRNVCISYCSWTILYWIIYQ